MEITLRIILLQLTSILVRAQYNGDTFPLWLEPVIQRPVDIMTDVVNDLGVRILQQYTNDGNVAFSPTGAGFVLAALYEGSAGRGNEEIAEALGLPRDRDIMRVGLRDVHRRLRSYLSADGFLGGLTLNKENTKLRPEYEDILRFYGFDLSSIEPEENNVTSVSEDMTTTPMSVSSEIIINETTTTDGPSTDESMTDAPTTLINQENSTETSTNENVVTITPEVSTSASEVTTQPDASLNVTESPTTMASSIEDFSVVTNLSSLPERVTVATTMPVSVTAETVTIASRFSETTLNSLASISTTITSQDQSSLTTEIPSMESTTAEISTENSTTVSTTTVPATTTVTITTGPPTTSTPVPDTSVETLPPLTTPGQMDSSAAIVSQTTITSTSTEQPTTSIPETTSMGTTPGTTAVPNTSPADTTSAEDALITSRQQVSTTMIVDTTITTDAASTDSTSIDPMALGTPNSESMSTTLGTTSTIQDAITTMMMDPTSDSPLASLTASTDPTTNSAPLNEATITSQAQSNPTVTEDPVMKILLESTTASTDTTVVTTTGVNVNKNTTEIPDMTSTSPASDSTMTIPMETTLPPTESSLSGQIRRRSTRSPRGYFSNFPDEGIWMQDLGFWRDYIPGTGEATVRDSTELSFLVNGCDVTSVSAAAYTAVLPFAYLPSIQAVALEFPLDDPRYNILLLLPTERGGTHRLSRDLSTLTIRQLRRELQPTWVRATIPSFMLRGFVTLTPFLQRLGIRDVFEPRSADLSPMTPDLGVYARDIQQSIGVNIRNYMKPDRTHSRNGLFERAGPVSFTAEHPFLYFIIDAQTAVSLIAGRIDDPLNSRIL
ncbi:mucin-5AC isoform X2 [Cephus cinctus]|uniref:Mucin-5AC isoform X2 n=1 Tax=Cephus cinctus TaxID=211228 RepID=A0AAJ7C097_CEPCN|nr:mucin-5AC isoform X2 [Cephus cinctus]